MPKIFITRKIPEFGIDLLKNKGYDVTVNPYPKILKKKNLIKMAKGSDALLCLLNDKIDEEILDGIGNQLKIVSNMAVGLDNIDIEACRERNVAVANTPNVLTDAVADHAFALMLALARRIVEADSFTRSGKYNGWDPMLFLGSDICGKNLGIIGFGRIGRALAKRAAKGFGMKVIYTDIKKNENFEREFNAQYKDLQTLLRESDFISIHVPLLESTRRIIGAKQLAMMKKNAYLINTSRGPIIDENALAEALKKKQIKGAALDVFEIEPKITKGLIRLENVVLTPHIASATKETRDRMSQIAAQNIISELEGQ